MPYFEIKHLSLLICLSFFNALACAVINASEQSPGILFHASFDGTRKAEIARGCDIPSRLKYASFSRNMLEGTFIDGKFGKAITGKNTFGWYWALGNFNPERGTLAFFINKKGFPYGFEPFSVMTVDQYYWYRYIMLKSPRTNPSFSTRFVRDCGLLALYPTDAKSKDFTDGKWHHVAIAWDQAYGANVYLDGKLYASKWGGISWLTKGIDPDYFLMLNSDDVAYDELYVFDRPLSGSQIQRLAEKNQPPSPSELQPLIFDEQRRANRIKELSWENAEVIPLKAKLGTENNVAQVSPKAVRSSKQSYFPVLDGKLGTAWPYTYGYEYSKGLHVEIDKPYDYMQIEGGFTGKAYAGLNLLEDEKASPLLEIGKTGFMYRKRFNKGNAPLELSFFRYRLPDQKANGNAVDSVTDQDENDEITALGRIAELSFFKTGECNADRDKVRKFHLGKLSAAAGEEALKSEFGGRFSVWDQNVITSGANPLDSAAAENLEALHYYHIVIPSPAERTVLDGLKLSLRLTGKVNGNIVRIEMRDPTIPARRCTALDFEIQGSGNASELSIALDTPDAMLFPGSHVWITLCFRDPLQLLTGPGQDSSVELFLSDKEKNIREYADREMEFVKSRFTELSEGRPWVSLAEPEKELPPYNPAMKELFLPLLRVREAIPGDSRANAIWNWTHKMITDESPVVPAPVAGCENAPAWALLQRELLNGCRGVYYWWIDNRQAPNGEFGNDLGDDSDFIQDFVKPALFSDPGGKFKNAITMVADACYRQRLKNGINKVTTDYLHAYEEGVNAQVAAAMADYGNPQYVERLMETSRTVRDFLTAKDGKGRRRFKANTYGADEVKDAGSTGVDIPSNVLMLHPALIMSYYSRNPGAFALVEEWCDGWRSYCGEAKKSGRKDLPVATKMDGSVARYDRKIGGFGVHDAFAALYDMTRKSEHRDTSIFQDSPDIPPIKELPLYGMIDKEKFKGTLIAQLRQTDLSHPTTDRFGVIAARKYLLYELDGDEKAAIQSLEACIRNLRMLYDAYTWAEPWNDRIWVPDNPAIAMALGDIPHERNQLWPRHYVSYEGLHDFAAWVREKSETRLKILLYSFSPEEQKGKVRVWRNLAGTYSIAMNTVEGDTAVKLQDSKAILQRADGFQITLPPRKLCSLELNLEKKTDYDILARSDLAISQADVVGTAVKIHNLGNKAAEKIKIRITDSANNIVEEKTIGRLDAPVDLNPRTATVDFTKTPQRPFKIAIDPDESIPEIYKFNNTVEIR